MNTRLFTKPLLKLLLTGLLLLHFSHPVLASIEFTTTFDSTYQVLESGLTNVEHQIQIKNNLSHIYTTQYSIAIGENNLTNIRVKSNDHNAPTKIVASDTTTTLTITIPNPVVGKDQITKLNISYTSQNIAEHTGKIWELNIPKLAKANEAESYSRTISYPQSLGLPSVAFPLAKQILNPDNNGGISLIYQGFPTDSITLLFGSSQLYDLSLKYLINNPTHNLVKTEIALPPDTAYQLVTLDSLSPPPEKIKLDADQNWLAIYPLEGGESLSIEAHVYIELYPQPHFQFSTSVPDELTDPQTYWETNNETIRSLAGKLKTPENIYNYLLDNYSYNYGRVGVGSERLGALQALSSPNLALCTEFTDTFIALARAMGIPAREINGYANTTNDSLRPLELATDVLHAWPEYYDAPTSHWLQIDPTWGKTTGGIDYFSKMDFNHLTFVRHGQESVYPYPAGAYKPDSREKTVSVTFTDQLPNPVESYKLTTIENITTITNTGNVALHDYSITLKDGSSYLVAYLPPFGREIIPPPTPSKLSLFSRFLNWLTNLFAR